MRKFLLCAGALALVGCGQTSTYVKSDTTLGRVVVYRNGVAYFERTAEVEGDSLKLHVPSDKVDDFLKSLTVVDATTGEPAPISYPAASEGGTIDMKIDVSKTRGKGPRRLRLSYVTEAPSWKPSYRVVVDKTGKVDVQGWAIVDNTSGEDWRDVRLGVGASSAMSFRYDLKGLRIVERETLHDNELFAQAPPMGGAVFGNAHGARLVGDFSDDALALADGDPSTTVSEETQRRVATGHKKPTAPGPTTKTDAKRRPVDPVVQAAQALRGTKNTIVVEGYASSGDEDKLGASLERANRLRDQLVQNGVDPNKVVAVGKGELAGRAGGARIVEAPIKDKAADKENDQGQGTTGAAAPKPSTDPIGTSHFESSAAMTVPKGTSAMVSILRAKTEGEVVYLYDPESPRGNTQFPFRTVRFRNPTASALESGPVSVFGDGKFIGEGLADPIPARAVAFVPFALDRQIVVERKDADRDEIAKIITVQRGVFSTEVKHIRRATFTLYNRMSERAVVYLRHTVPTGYDLTRAPESPDDEKLGSPVDEHLGAARLFRVELGANAKTDVILEEATPVLRTTDIRTTEGLDLVRAYISSAALDGKLGREVEQLLKLNADMAKIEQQISTTHEQMGEYRMRMDELHAQLVTLKAVKTAGPLMAHLEKKLQEISEKLSRATVEVVGLQEKLMIARVQFQTGVADLTLEKSDGKPAEKATAAN